MDIRDPQVALRLDDGSRMSGDVHVRFCESLGVKFPRATHPNDALSNSPSIDTTLLDPAPVFVAKFSGPSQLELSTQRDRISYPFFRRDYSRADDRPNSGNVPSRSDISTSLPATSCSSLGGSNFCVSGVTTSIVINDVARPIKSAGNSGAT